MINRKTINEIIRFGITGGLATVLQYVTYYILVSVLNVNVALAIGYAVSFVFNYFMSARFTFREKTSKKNGIGFCCAHAVNFMLQAGFLNLFLSLGLDKKIALIPVFCICIPVNFILVRFAFHRK